MVWKLGSFSFEWPSYQAEYAFCRAEWNSGDIVARYGTLFRLVILLDQFLQKRPNADRYQHVSEEQKTSRSCKAQASYLQQK
jgi:hypothetical protein